MKCLIAWMLSPQVDAFTFTSAISACEKARIRVDQKVLFHDAKLRIRNAFPCRWTPCGSWKFNFFCLSIMNLEKVLPNCNIIMYNIMGKNMVIQESSIYHFICLAASFRHANRRLTRRNRMELPWSFRSFKSYQRWTKERPENGQKWCGKKGSF